MSLGTCYSQLRFIRQFGLMVLVWCWNYLVVILFKFFCQSGLRIDNIGLKATAPISTTARILITEDGMERICNRTNVFFSSRTKFNELFLVQLAAPTLLAGLLLVSCGCGSSSNSKQSNETGIAQGNDTEINAADSLALEGEVDKADTGKLHVVTVSATAEQGNSVGGIEIPFTQWTPIPDGSFVDQEWGERSLHATRSIGNETFSVYLDWGDSKTPSKLFWKAGDEELSKPIELNWKELSGDYFMYHKKSSGTPFSEIACFVREDSIEKCSLAFNSLFQGKFEMDQLEMTCMLLDGDGDLEISSDNDRWVAGPTDIVTQIEFANPSYDMHRLDESWCWNGVKFDFANCKESTLQLKTSLGHSDSESWERHIARIQKEFESTMPARKLMLEKKGDAPDRPLAESPVEWFYCANFDKAVQYASSSGKPLLVEYTSTTCGWCRILGYVTINDKELNELLANFACVKFLGEFDPAETYKKQGVESFPQIKIFSPETLKELHSISGFKPPSKLVAELESALSNFE